MEAINSFKEIFLEVWNEGVFGLNRRWVPSDFQFENFEKSYGFVVCIGQK